MFVILFNVLLVKFQVVFEVGNTMQRLHSEVKRKSFSIYGSCFFKNVLEHAFVAAVTFPNIDGGAMLRLANELTSSCSANDKRGQGSRRLLAAIDQHQSISLRAAATNALPHLDECRSCHFSSRLAVAATAAADGLPTLMYAVPYPGCGSDADYQARRTPSRRKL